LGCTLGEALLKPTRIYTETVLNVIKNFHVHGVVHITGGGFTDNIPRVLPNGCKASIKKGSWPKQPIFDFLQKKGKVSTEEMFRTFNCGIGMVLIVKAKEVDDIMSQLTALAESPYLIGEIASLKGEDDARVEIV